MRRVLMALAVLATGTTLVFASSHEIEVCGSGHAQKTRFRGVAPGPARCPRGPLKQL